MSDERLTQPEDKVEEFAHWLVTLSKPHLWLLAMDAETFLYSMILFMDTILFSDEDTPTLETQLELVDKFAGDWKILIERRMKFDDADVV